MKKTISTWGWLWLILATFLAFSFWNHIRLQAAEDALPHAWAVVEKGEPSRVFPDGVERPVEKAILKGPYDTHAICLSVEGGDDDDYQGCEYLTVDDIKKYYSPQ